ncbi:LapA family protein [Sutterella sp.]|uniref:LapA family protein n=1 Tax=Sutterella sp. TaxID=1981025 RepID=UPI0026DF7E9E|nr:LapA family protein [Sutterella sp.]MDO5530626.1 LapA family protein [Sutterella sp.]
MKLRTLFLMLILVLLAVFLIINWSALSQVTTVNLVVEEIQAPLGVIVVGAFAVVVLIMMLYTIFQQASVVMEIRQAHKDTRAARQAADEADKSRVTELGREVKARLDQLEALIVAKTDEVEKLIRERGDAADREIALLRDQMKEEQAATQNAVSERLLNIDKKVSDVLPASEGEIKDEKKKKELFGDLF